MNDCFRQIEALDREITLEVVVCGVLPHSFLSGSDETPGVLTQFMGKSYEAGGPATKTS